MTHPEPNYLPVEHGGYVLHLSDTEVLHLADALDYAVEQQGKRVNSLKAGTNKRLDAARRFRRFTTARDAVQPAADSIKAARLARLHATLANG